MEGAKTTSAASQPFDKDAAKKSEEERGNQPKDLYGVCSILFDKLS